MRKLIIASAVALGTTLGFGGAASAASVTVQLGTNHHYYRPVYHHHHHWRHRHCVNKTVITYRHHRKIIRHERVCHH